MTMQVSVMNERMNERMNQRMIEGMELLRRMVMFS